MIDKDVKIINVWNQIKYQITSDSGITKKRCQNLAIVKGIIRFYLGDLRLFGYGVIPFHKNKW